MTTDNWLPDEQTRTQQQRILRNADTIHAVVSPPYIVQVTKTAAQTLLESAPEGHFYLFKLENRGVLIDNYQELISFALDAIMAESHDTTLITEALKT